MFFGSSSSKSWWKRMYPWMDLKKRLIHFNGIKIEKKTSLKNIKKKIQISFAGRIEKRIILNFFKYCSRIFKKRKQRGF